MTNRNRKKVQLAVYTAALFLFGILNIFTDHPAFWEIVTGLLALAAGAGTAYALIAYLMTYKDHFFTTLKNYRSEKIEWKLAPTLKLVSALFGGSLVVATILYVVDANFLCFVFSIYAIVWFVLTCVVGFKLFNAWVNAEDD